MTNALWIWLAAMLGMWIGVIVERSFAAHRCAVQDCSEQPTVTLINSSGTMHLCHAHHMRFFGYAAFYRRS